jgi:hypothetical protein
MTELELPVKFSVFPAEASIYCRATWPHSFFKHEFDFPPRPLRSLRLKGYSNVLCT